jgi:protein ImuB
VVLVPASGPAGYFGGEQEAAERLVDHVAAGSGAESQVGVADGLFAAVLAARRGMVVPHGQTAGFLAELDVADLGYAGGVPDAGRAALIDLLRRLGLRSMGQFAALDERAVASRFGADAVLAHRQARGLDEQPLARRHPPAELAVSEPFDPPVDRVDAAAFAARSLAERLHEVLAARGYACSRLGIHAVTGSGDRHYRVWRCAEPLSSASAAGAIADRVRWQLESWLTEGSGGPDAGLVELRLEPEEVLGGQALQAGLWSGHGQEAAERAGRALSRAQALLGPDRVCVPVLRGGRGPADRVRLVPWGDTTPEETAPDAPWPGRLPAPTPAVVFPDPAPASLTDAAGREVGVTARALLTAEPAEVTAAGSEPAAVLAWAGPWPVDERWWEPGGGLRLARMQVLAAGPSFGEQHGLLLSIREGRWFVEGRYD